MSALKDSEMERLSDLLGQGTLCNAPEIAKLLKVELSKKHDRLANINRYRERIFEKLIPFFRTQHS